MFTRSIELFRTFGFSIRIDLSWFVIATLVAWSLALGMFPRIAPGLTPQVYWTMGVVGVLGLFGSVVLHELAHALVARRFGLRIRGITLFIFGGVAEMEDEPPSPAAEFWVAIAGPIASVLIAAACFGLQTVGLAGGWPDPAIAVLWYLWTINLVLVGFNLIPAFPLDGGRVLRSALWRWKRNLRWATRVTSEIGSGFGIAMIALGVLRIIVGDFVGGMWTALIGMFLRHAARMAYQQLLIRRALEGEPVSRFMQADVHTVPASATLQDFVDRYVYRCHHKMFPVVDGERLIGCVSTRQLLDVPRDMWPTQTVGPLARRCADENTISADADAMEALSRMSRTGASRLLVIDHGELRGILCLKDLLRFIALKVELEDQGLPTPPDSDRTPGIELGRPADGWAR